MKVGFCLYNRPAFIPHCVILKQFEFVFAPMIVVLCLWAVMNNLWEVCHTGPTDPCLLKRLGPYLSAQSIACRLSTTTQGHGHEAAQSEFGHSATPTLTPSPEIKAAPTVRLTPSWDIDLGIPVLPDPWLKFQILVPGLYDLGFEISQRRENFIQIMSQGTLPSVGLQLMIPQPAKVQKESRG